MIRFNEDNTTVEKESFRAVLAGVQLREDISRSMDELAALAEAAGAEVAGIMVQSRDAPERATYLGKGKAAELAELCHNMEADTIIFNDELSGIQIRNLEALTELRIIDRTVLILDIFASRASSKEGRLQVELAQLQYRRPRLTGLGKSLSRLGGGIGTRGPGEKKLETDRRHIDRRMDEIKRDLAETVASRDVRRSLRRKNEVPVVALVGYTNSGKSAIMNRILSMTNQEDKLVLEKDMLFATLDTFQRQIKLENNKEFILEDTVGFVSKLPHGLVKAFKATLEEVVEADLLLHIVDCTFEDQDFHMKVVENVLAELHASGKETIMVFNKVDLLEPSAFSATGVPGEEMAVLAAEMPRKAVGTGEVSETVAVSANEGPEEAVVTGGGSKVVAVSSAEKALDADKIVKSVFVSAKRGDNMELLLKGIKQHLFSGHRQAKLMIPYDRGDLVSYLSEKMHVLERDYTEEGVYIRVDLPDADYNRLIKYLQ
ncbi:GTPase HflX [Clostridia bacterium]|nr:GTPase HflX [Clostridia bacterium]